MRGETVSRRVSSEGVLVYQASDWTDDLAG
jgi:hypothetical protein